MADQVYVLFDCRDYYGPYFQSVHRTLAGAQAEVTRLMREASDRELRPYPGDGTRWETPFGSYRVDLTDLRP